MWNVPCSLASNLTKQMLGGRGREGEKQLRLANKPGINIPNPEWKVWFEFKMKVQNCFLLTGGETTNMQLKQFSIFL